MKRERERERERERKRKRERERERERERFYNTSVMMNKLFIWIIVFVSKVQ